ncbi:ABC-type oligopeptide transport system, ATPase component [Marinomonas sp. MED121]|uniref:ABC transporter ATP-binding protein n=1 Tax=Marinomonas sp. MED121 TaxID=314277 RepID=UPI000068FB4D|nr:ABC transporter ATP-binding protein [Marinomonas sp. MED121]EAQ65104.1 ABC-type oligopeptide transport system, ATPase component [Marinomonas sp. MED121]
MMNELNTPVLKASGLIKDFPIGSGNKASMRALNDISFELHKGQALAIVGESGSGKSTSARILSRIFEETAGLIEYKGIKLKDFIKKFGRLEYARQVQMVFQDPFGSLNPVHTIYHHIARPLLIHKRTDKQGVEQAVYDLLELVGLSPAYETSLKYPHQLSGGQRQRVAIARAIAVEPEVILADEPISMLDVSVRLGILNLMAELKDKRGISFMYITHDIATARYFAEKTAVMYLGHMVEWGDSDAVTQTPQHPYTQLLLSAVADSARKDTVEFKANTGEIPLWGKESKGCPFVSRCHKVIEPCHQTMPAIKEISSGHFIRCYQV